MAGMTRSEAKMKVGNLKTNLSGKLKLVENPTRITGTSYEDICTFIMIFC